VVASGRFCICIGFIITIAIIFAIEFALSALFAFEYAVATDSALAPIENVCTIVSLFDLDVIFHHRYHFFHHHCRYRFFMIVIAFT